MTSTNSPRHFQAHFPVAPAQRRRTTLRNKIAEIYHYRLAGQFGKTFGCNRNAGKTSCQAGQCLGHLVLRERKATWFKSYNALYLGVVHRRHPSGETAGRVCHEHMVTYLAGHRVKGGDIKLMIAQVGNHLSEKLETLSESFGN